jgi:hypothetical protein
VQSTWGGLGKVTRSLHRRTRFPPALAAARPELRWLDPVARYGTDEPDPEVVIEAPL